MRTLQGTVSLIKADRGVLIAASKFRLSSKIKINKCDADSAIWNFLASNKFAEFLILAVFSFKYFYLFFFFHSFLRIKEAHKESEKLFNACQGMTLGSCLNNARLRDFRERNSGSHKDKSTTSCSCLLHRLLHSLRSSKLNLVWPFFPLRFKFFSRKMSCLLFVVSLPFPA